MPATLSCLLLTSAAVLTAAMAASQTSEPAPPISDVLASMTGPWTGELAYRDYQSDERVALPAVRDAQLSSIGPFLVQELGFVDPGSRHTSHQLVAVDDAGTVSVIMMTPEGLVREAYETRETDVNDAMRDWRFVLQRIGMDDHRPADIRLTQILKDGVLTARKDVRYHDVGQWEFRNETRFEREPIDAEQLVGVWRVDTRPSPTADPHLTELRIDSVKDGRIEGAFYGSPIYDGYVNVAWGELQFAFISDDAGGPYFTSGTVSGDQLRGRTHCPHREFLNVWHGKRR